MAILEDRAAQMIAAGLCAAPHDNFAVLCTMRPHSETVAHHNQYAGIYWGQTGTVIVPAAAQADEAPYVTTDQLRRQLLELSSDSHDAWRALTAIRDQRWSIDIDEQLTEAEADPIYQLLDGLTRQLAVVASTTRGIAAVLSARLAE